ncbi:MAG TPA: DUF559 domain-containing protein [Sphingomonadaceae bacterium]|nr:DUF559 domain-containing protein [Sphingomonadaceae bacterium]
MLERVAHIRRNPTEPERRLWQELRGGRLAGHKFRRQATIGSRIADFFARPRVLSWNRTATRMTARAISRAMRTLPQGSVTGPFDSRMRM